MVAYLFILSVLIRVNSSHQSIKKENWTVFAFLWHAINEAFQCNPAAEDSLNWDKIRQMNQISNFSSFYLLSCFFFLLKYRRYFNRFSIVLIQIIQLESMKWQWLTHEIHMKWQYIENESKTSKIIFKIISYTILTRTQNPLIKWKRVMLVAIIAINCNTNIAEIIVEIP